VIGVGAVAMRPVASQSLWCRWRRSPGRKADESLRQQFSRRGVDGFHGFRAAREGARSHRCRGE
jgi:hypothetical protein